MRRAAIATVTAVLILGLTGCSSPFIDACPAIGFVNSLAVDASAIEGFTGLQFCVDDDCSPRDGETPPTGEPLPLFGVTQEGDDWILHLDMSAPEKVVIRLFAADGSLIQESEHSIQWTPPTGPCGGESTAPPIILDP